MSDRQNEQDRQDVSFDDPQAAREHSQRRREYLKHINELRLTQAEVASLFRQEEAKLQEYDGSAGLTSCVADPYSDFWADVLMRPMSAKEHEQFAMSGYFLPSEKKLTPSIDGIKVLMALARWAEKGDAPAPKHTELEFIYSSGFNDAVAAMCRALAGKNLDDLPVYFADNHHLKMLKLFGGGQCVVNELLRELGIKVHPEAEDRRSA